MCGRAYETYTEEELEARYSWLKLKKNPLGIRSNFNLCPTQTSPVVFTDGENAAVGLFRWGLVPAWAKDLKSVMKYSLINAKGEEILEKRSYKTPFEKRRCIIPLSGFFEWKAEGGPPKRPFAIHLKDKTIMSVAGVWEHWKQPLTSATADASTHAEAIDSFAIITTEANSLMKQIHHRMPVILSPEDERLWLNPNNSDFKQLHKLLKPCPPEWLECFEVSRLVNSPKNNSEDILKNIGS